MLSVVAMGREPQKGLISPTRFEKGRQLNDDDRLIWSHFISKFGWSDFATARLEELKQKHGVSDRKDIMTIADAIDLDEKRKS
jgi:hypothetical protein